MPISVIPNCTVERKRLGSAARARALCAPANPASSICCSRILREETTAISDIANSALIRIRIASIRSSMCFVSSEVMSALHHDAAALAGSANRAYCSAAATACDVRACNCAGGKLPRPSQMRAWGITHQSTLELPSSRGALRFECTTYRTEEGRRAAKFCSAFAYGERADGLIDVK